MITNIAYYRAIKLISKDKTFGFTDYPEDFTINNTTYDSINTVQIGDIELNTILSSTYMNFIINLDSNTKDILNYKSQFTVEISCIKAVNENINLIKLKTGKISEIKIENNKLSAEVKFIINQLSNNINARYTTNCKACFGDSKCKINTEDYIISNIKALNATEDCIKIDTQNAIFPPKLHNIKQNDLKKLIENGYIIDENGFKYAKIIKYDSKQLQVEYIKLKPSLLEHSFIKLQCACDKTSSQCKEFFNNKIQFRGEIFNLR